LVSYKRSAEKFDAAFTDHNAAVVPLALQATNIRWGMGRWRLNITLLQEETRNRFHRQWEEWKKRIPKYRTMLEWWDIMLKRGVRDSLRRKDAKWQETAAI
jgi:hypothetical protein